MKLRSFIPSFLILLFLIPYYVLPQGTWERVVVPTMHNLRSVSFPDSLNGWAVGDSGTILHTGDGGNTWTQQDSPVENDIVYVFFLNQNLGWAAALNFTEPPFGTILLKTSNGGDSWGSSLYPDENIFISCIHYFDSLTGWMGGKPHALVKTIDGGNIWTQAAIDTSTLAFFPVLTIAFLNQEVGYASGGMFDIAGVIWRTQNGGDLWYAIDPSQAPADEVHGLHIFDEMHVMGSGGDPDYGYGVGMIRSSDGGVNWNYDEIGVQGIAYDIDFRTSSQAWSPLGPLCKLIFSLDSGDTWTEIPTPDSAAIYDITFPDSLHGYGVGNRGAVLKYRPPVQPGVPSMKGSSEVLRMYPNPTSGITNYELRITKEGDCQLEVFDLLGSKIAEVVREILPPGIHSFSFDASRLPEGVYLYQLRIDGVVSDKGKLIVIR
ncbi:MAG: T9SS type A sorting domain-containing protein [Bacteroidales bacterium]|nr:T9SS type A sorting domain-containing protein [Bacteroidales bacterium]